MHRLLAPTVRAHLAAPRLHCAFALLSTAPQRRASGRGNVSEDELLQARRWLEQLRAETIPRSIGELSFSRSSGPGGQNVNKYAWR
jgi:peptidyl-tRNA hydrolase ICT1